MDRRFSIRNIWHGAISAMGKAFKPALLLASLCLSPISLSAETQLTDVMGHKFALNRTPMRVISLAPSITEMMFALGQGGRLVGVTSFCNYPPERLKDVPKMGGTQDFDLEKIVAAKPELILALALSGNSKRRVEQLVKAVGNKVFVFAGATMEDMFSLIEQLGLLFGVEKRAAELAQSIRRDVQAVASKSKKRPKRRVLYLVGCRPEVAAGRDSFVNEWIEIAGGENILKDSVGYPKVSLEGVLVAKPDIIFLSNAEGDKSCEKFAKDNRKLSNVTIKPLSADLFQRPGPRVVEAVRSLFTHMHGNRSL